MIMHDKWQFMNLMEKAVALRVANLALWAMINEPGRTLEECVVQEVRTIHWTLTEHLPWIQAEWTDPSDEEAIEHWKDAAFEAITEIVFASESLLERGGLPATVLSEILRAPGVELN